MNEIIIFGNSTNLDRAMAEKLRQNALKTQSEGRNFSVALCGRKTPYGF
jgi:6-phosphogluconolactonase/glucosamine-6-phosphate isomerase/deaminase